MTLEPFDPHRRGVLLDGKAVAAEIRAEVAQHVATMVSQGHRPPGLTAILVGDDPASHVYVRNKAKACEKAGLVGNTLLLDASITTEQLLAEIDALNADDTVDGILVQLPLPKGMPQSEVLSRVSPDKDVDGFHTVNVGRLWAGEEGFRPATPSGVIEMLDRAGVELSGKNAVVVGRSTIVGKPMAALLLERNCTVTICHSRTRDLAAVCRTADILVAAVGVSSLIGPDHIQDGAIVVDVGTNRITDRAEVERLFPGNEKRLATLERRGGVLVGDVDFTRTAPKAAAISPVPGGVGPLTIAMLLVNTLIAGRRRQGLSALPEDG